MADAAPLFVSYADMAKPSPLRPACIIHLVVVVVLVLLIVMYVTCRCRKSEGFAVSAQSREIANKASQLFSSTPNATYTQYKEVIPQADPVQFADLRAMWSRGQLTPENVENAEKN